MDQFLYSLTCHVSEELKTLQQIAFLRHHPDVSRSRLAAAMQHLPEKINSLPQSDVTEHLKKRWAGWTEFRLDAGKDPNLEGLARMLAMHYRQRTVENNAP